MWYSGAVRGVRARHAATSGGSLEWSIAVLGYCKEAVEGVRDATPPMARSGYSGVLSAIPPQDLPPAPPGPEAIAIVFGS